MSTSGLVVNETTRLRQGATYSSGSPYDTGYMGGELPDVESMEEEPLGPVSGLWRSEDMELRSMSIERSVLERVVRRLGNLGCVQFRDMNTTAGWNADAPEEKQTHSRHFVTQVRTCEAVERSLRYFDEQLTANDVNVKQIEKMEQLTLSDAPLGVEDFRGTPQFEDLPNALETLCHKLAQDETSLKDQCDKLSKYTGEYTVAVERGIAASWAEKCCGSAGLDRAADSISRSEDPHSHLDDGGTALQTVGGGGSLGQLVGTIAADKMDVFNRLIYRVTKGHALVTQMPLENPHATVEKRIFRILYSSFEMQSRILKLTAANGADVYFGRILVAADGRQDPKAAGIQALPSSGQQYKQLELDNQRDVEDRKKLIESTQGMVLTKLGSIARVHTARRHYVLKEKAMYHVLNMMQIDKGTSFANAIAWIPARQIRKVEAVLGQFHLCRLNETDLKGTDDESPPTYFETNDFTGTFQGIVDSYGVPRYHEVNPAIFTIVTFPFFFGLMYGDVGHGILITIVASLLIFFQDKLKKAQLNEMVDMVFGARWLLLLMGLSAIYVGFLYNDTFGLMLDYSGSTFMFPKDWVQGNAFVNSSSNYCYQGDNVPLVCQECNMRDLVYIPVTTNNITAMRCTCPGANLVPGDTKYSCPDWPGIDGSMKPSDGPTPFGFDSAWHMADNKLTIYNSYKMKNAVIVGVLQMTLGLFLSLFNNLYFEDYRHIWFGFIPQLIFLFATFGYMCVMLIVKWVSPWDNTNLAPNILETMTNFFLSPGTYNNFDPAKCAADSSDCDGYNYLYSGQKSVQVVLIIVAVAMIPLLLVPIPYLAAQDNKRKKRESEANGTVYAPVDMQEVIIKQVIHAIEFVLGCVSNTASYLRLWALSLAHAELSEVFWDFAIMKLLHGANGIGGGFVMWIGFGAWLSATLAVLVVMEALSAFLHALRLHWVEFQNKFYLGDGTPFSPLNYSELIREADAARA